MTDSSEFGDKYHLIWLMPRTKTVGEVRNYTLDLKRYRRIPISLDDDFMKKLNTRFLATEWTNIGPKILVNTAFMATPCSLREAAIWHEVGHIHHEHFLRKEFCDQSQFRESGVTPAEKEASLLMEEQADCFAVLQSGKEAMTGFLQYLLHARPSGGKGGWNEIGKRELEVRITAIRTYQA